MTNSTEVQSIIKSLNPVGGGIDKINTNILLLTYQSIIHHLTFFFNLCLSTAVFPDHLKVAIIKPIYKTGDRNVLITSDQFLCYLSFRKFWKKYCNLLFQLTLMNTIY